MGYEQLLSIQQHQHELAMHHKEAEVAHMRARMDLVEANHPSETKHMAAVLQTKDEESSLMMAAKHKELELMAGLLQLREQQIEDFRQLCEAQRMEIQHLKRLRAFQDLADDGQRSSQAPCDHNSSRDMLVTAGSPAPSSPAQEEHALLQREVRRLRLRMEELEAAVGDQHDRSSGLARALEVKTDRVRALEEQVRGLRSPVGMGIDTDQESVPGGFPSQEVLPLPGATGPAGSSRPSPPRLLLPPSQYGHDRGLMQERDQREARNMEGSLGGLASRSVTSLSSVHLEPSTPQLPTLSAEHHRDYQSGARKDWQQAFGGLEVGSRPLSCRTRPSMAASDEPGDATSIPPSGHQTYRSAVHVDRGGSSVEGPAGFWSGASEAAETNRWRQESLREMRRLRLQMSELERMAGKGAPSLRGGPSVNGAERPFGGSASQDRLLTSASSFGGGSSADGLGAAVTEPVTEVASLDPGRRRQASSATSTTALGPAGSNGRAWPWSRHASEAALRSIGSGNLSSVAGRSVQSEDHAASDVAAGWEYRPHSSGDPVDAAVAALVNRPGGRYRGWRALLCRLERGVYLCGTRRINLRADAASELIEASDDGGKSWSDLEDLMRGAEASQHALLVRARDAAGLTA